MEKNNQATLLLMVFGAAGSILTGILFFGKLVFVVDSPFFIFFTGGLFGSILFAFFYARKQKEAIFGGLFIFLLTYLITSGHYFVTQMFYFIGIAVAVYLFARWFFPKMSKWKFLRPLVLALLLAVIFMTVHLTLIMIYYSHNIQLLPIKTMPVSVLMGLGLGVGIEVAGYINARFE